MMCTSSTHFIGSRVGVGSSVNFGTTFCLPKVDVSLQAGQRGHIAPWAACAMCTGERLQHL